MKKSLLFILLVSVMLLTIGCGKDKKEEGYGLTFDGVKIVPGEKIDISKFKKEYEKSEVPDCALGGKGINYTFEELEISTNEEGIVYSIYVIDPNVKTDEGVYLGDEVKTVKEKYGNADLLSGIMTYSRGGVELTFVIDKDKVIGIEYNMIIKE